MYFLSKFLEKIFLKINGAKFIFEDYYQNKYFELSKKDYSGSFVRYVVYFCSKNASFIPGFCDQWLRGNLSNEDLKNSNHVFEKISYLKPHSPDLTGTKNRFLPKFHPLNRSKNNIQLKSIYKNWNPE